MALKRKELEDWNIDTCPAVILHSEDGGTGKTTILNSVLLCTGRPESSAISGELLIHIFFNMLS